MERAPCKCHLPYTGEDHHLLPLSVLGENCVARRTYNIVSYRMLFDFLLLEMTDGCSESGYISAFNRKRRMFAGGNKECSKQVWLGAVEDFENAISADESEAFSCSKCPSEHSPGDGQDEVHIGDGISESTQVDLVPEQVKNDKEKVANISGVEGIELAERTIIVQSKVRKVFSGLFNGFSKQKSSKKPSEITVADIKTAIKKLKNLVKEKFEGETRMLELLEYISNKGEKNVPQCYIDLIYELAKNTPVVGILQSNSRIFKAALKSFLDGLVNIFEDKDVLDHLNDEVPVVMEMISNIIKHEKVYFLPEPVSNMFEFILKLFNQV